MLISSCILLMSLDQHSSIPVDRHVFQFAERWYHIRSKKYEVIADRLRELWGERAGWAHTVLFYADLPSFDHYHGSIENNLSKENILCEDPKPRKRARPSLISDEDTTSAATKQARSRT